MKTVPNKQARRYSIHWYNISSACEQIGLSRRQLYYWEHIGIIKPRYQPFGAYSYRCYSKADIEKLVKIKKYLNQGYTLKAATQFAEEKNGH